MVSAPVHTHPAFECSDAQVLRIVADDGVALHVEAYGDAAAMPVVMAHGFGQSRLAWTESAKALAQAGFYCLAADGRGHGLSSWNGSARYHMDQYVDDARRLAEHVGRKPIWVGASMGGLVGMVAEAESAGGLFEAMVLVDITPRWEPEGVGRILDFMRAHPSGFASVNEARDAVVHYLPHRASSASSERLAKMLVAMPNGRLRWHWDPRLLNEVGVGIEEHFARLNHAAAQLKLPMLLVSGGRSDVVSDATIEEFMKLVPHARHQRIAHATHMVVGDDNHSFTQAVTDFVKTLS